MPKLFEFLKDLKIIRIYLFLYASKNLISYVQNYIKENNSSKWLIINKTLENCQTNRNPYLRKKYVLLLTCVVFQHLTKSLLEIVILLNIKTLKGQ